jgi:hypothetical protein
VTSARAIPNAAGVRQDHSFVPFFQAAAVPIASGASRTIGVSMGTAAIARYALIALSLILALRRVYSKRTGEEEWGKDNVYGRRTDRGYAIHQRQ